jgi:hypothetical protein
MERLRVVLALLESAQALLPDTAVALAIARTRREYLAAVVGAPPSSLGEALA